MDLLDEFCDITGVDVSNRQHICKRQWARNIKDLVSIIWNGIEPEPKKHNRSLLGRLQRKINQYRSQRELKKEIANEKMDEKLAALELLEDYKRAFSSTGLKFFGLTDDQIKVINDFSKNKTQGKRKHWFTNTYSSFHHKHKRNHKRDQKPKRTEGVTRVYTQTSPQTRYPERQSKIANYTQPAGAMKHDSGCITTKFTPWT